MRTGRRDSAPGRFDCPDGDARLATGTGGCAIDWDSAAGFDAARVYGDAGHDYVAAAERFWGFGSRGTVARLALRGGERVLDVACGAGASAIPAARAVGPRGHVLALDAAEPMLGLGRERARNEGLANLEFAHADMTELDLPAGSFDAVVCVLGIFFVPDMVDQTARLWSLVAPGGRLAITTLGPRFLAPMIDAFRHAAAAERPDVPLVLPWERTAEAATLAGILAGAGVPGPAIEHEQRRVALASPDDWWQAVMGSGLRRHVVAIGPEPAERVRALNARWMAEREVREVEIGVLYALATRAA